MHTFRKLALTCVAALFAAACGETGEVMSPPPNLDVVSACGSNTGGGDPCISIEALDDEFSATSIMAIANPDAAYVTGTTLINISGIPNFTNVGSITDGTMTVGFSSAMNKRHAEVSGWATWGDPPFTELFRPHVLYSNGARTVTLNLSQPALTFGFEIEPNPFSNQTFTVDFINSSGPTTVGTIVRTVNGRHGARLIAGTLSSAVDRVKIAGTSDFAMGQVRYFSCPVPTVSVSASPTVLWPPNHEYVPIALTVTVNDPCNGTVVAHARSDEPDDANGNGDGGTTGDVKAGANLSENASPVVTFDPFTDQLELRAERAGGGNDRVYTILITATNPGGSSSATATVTVPHNQ